MNQLLCSDPCLRDIGPQNKARRHTSIQLCLNQWQGWSFRFSYGNLSTIIHYVQVKYDILLFATSKESSTRSSIVTKIICLRLFCYHLHAELYFLLDLDHLGKFQTRRRVLQLDIRMKYSEDPEIWINDLVRRSTGFKFQHGYNPGYCTHIHQHLLLELSTAHIHSKKFSLYYWIG